MSASKWGKHCCCGNNIGETIELHSSEAALQIGSQAELRILMRKAASRWMPKSCLMKKSAIMLNGVNKCWADGGKP